jgi:transcriptional regulator with XRE-family HTH domain
MEDEKRVHFGWFVGRERRARGLSRPAFIQRMGIKFTPRQLARIEENEKPTSGPQTLLAIATALGRESLESLDLAWRGSPGARPPKDERKGVRGEPKTVIVIRGEPHVVVRGIMKISGQDASTVVSQMILSAKQRAAAGIPIEPRKRRPAATKKVPKTK